MAREPAWRLNAYRSFPLTNAGGRVFFIIPARSPFDADVDDGSRKRYREFIADFASQRFRFPNVAGARLLDKKGDEPATFDLTTASGDVVWKFRQRLITTTE